MIASGGTDSLNRTFLEGKRAMSFFNTSTPTTPMPQTDEGFMEEDMAHIYALQADALNANQVEDLICGRGSLRDTEGVWHECGIQCNMLRLQDIRARL